MITTRAVPALLSVHHWRVASEATVKNDFADPLVTWRAPAAGERISQEMLGALPSLDC
jgi:hypothetical protein